MAIVGETAKTPDASARPRHPEKEHKPDAPIKRKPAWIRVKAPGSEAFRKTEKIVRDNKLVTVCEEAGCPNIGECWTRKHASFLIMGETCTRACAFCNVRTGIPNPLDGGEPVRIAEAVARMSLSHVVITSVDRDDLDDGGAEHFAQTISAIRERSPETTIEVLTPDFLRKDGALEIVVEAKPDVFNHNLETVPGKYLKVRPGARYFHSIRLLQRAKELDPTIFTKSGIMVGLGEERNEVLQLMDDLRSADVDFLTIGQYLQPSRKHSSGRPFPDARRVQGAERDRLCQGLPNGLGDAADALVAPCRRRFCQAEGGARRGEGFLARESVSSHMPQFETARRVHHSASNMFDLVADVERYPLFVPLCQSTRLKGRKTIDAHRDVIIADMTVAYKVFRETFTSRATLDRENLAITVAYLDGPFEHLDNRWTFKPVGEGQCDVGFYIEYEFRSRVLSGLMGAVFDKAFRKFSAAFEARADDIYGRPESRLKTL